MTVCIVILYHLSFINYYCIEFFFVVFQSMNPYGFV